jgi:hypothetical protein
MRAQEADAGGLASGDTHDLRAIIAAQVSPSFFSPSLCSLYPYSSVQACLGVLLGVLGTERNLTRACGRPRKSTTSRAWAH